MSRRDAREHAWIEAMKVYPRPGDPQEPASEPPQEPSTSEPAALDAQDQLAGMGSVPSDWGMLPANASLAAEIGWVQANRLANVEERPSGAAVVHLERARSPAPSLAALGWLETSIRSYAKYVDVVAKSLAGVQDEQYALRRERMRITDIESMLCDVAP